MNSFILDDISDVKMTDLQKAEFRKTIADIRVELTNQRISIFNIEYKNLLNKQPNSRDVKE